MATPIKPRVTSFAPQFLVDDLHRSIAYYQKIGLAFGEPWDGIYAKGRLDGLELHLKEAPKNQAERGTKDCYIEDPDGYVVCFDGRPATRKT